jgi:hypothetical protein
MPRMGLGLKPPQLESRSNAPGPSLRSHFGPRVLIYPLSGHAPPAPLTGIFSLTPEFDPPGGI